MFDNNKIALNHLRANNTKNKKVSLFFDKLFEDVLDRLDISKRNAGNILEIQAKNNSLKKVLEKKKIKCTFVQSLTSNFLKLDNNNTFLDSIDFANISENKFKYCIGVFPVISNSDISLKLKSVYRILSTGGKFIFLFHSAEGLQDIKYLFDKILSLKVEESFLPCFDIISLGNFTNSLGYKNVVVDKSKYIITTKNINEFFKFIRDMGESNYLLNRNKQSINKTKYARLQKYFEKKLAKNRMIDNQISISFLTGKKES